MKVELEAIAASVVGRVVPEIPGLPGGDELQELVAGKTLAVYLDGLADPDLAGFESDSRRRVLVVRVALVLAFPNLRVWSSGHY